MYATLLHLSVTHIYYCEITPGAHPYYMLGYIRTNLKYMVPHIRNCSKSNFKVGIPFVLIRLMFT